MGRPKTFVWSKVGPEAGLTLDQILSWKELQRLLSNGIFFWGVGSLPSAQKQHSFLRAVRKPQLLFTEQISKATDENINPASTVLWTHYRDRGGNEVALPRFAAVTSKEGRSRHGAIVARSVEPLALRDRLNFELGDFGNFEGKPNVAFQQSVAIIQKKENGNPRRIYDRGFWVDLVSPYFDELTRSRTLTRAEVRQISASMTETKLSKQRFKQLIDDLKRG